MLKFLIFFIKNVIIYMYLKKYILYFNFLFMKNTKIKEIVSDFKNKSFWKTLEQNKYFAKINLWNWKFITFEKNDLESFIKEIEETQKIIWWKNLFTF